MTFRLSWSLFWFSLSRSRTLCTKQVAAVGPDDERVQALVHRMTGMNFDKVFAPKKEPLRVPKYKLMTFQDLKEVHAETEAKAAELLKMPPVLPKREARGKTIERDERLEHYLDHKMVFTDTTQHMENNERRIVVRETDGTLREATWDERDRMCQVFFPVLGRKMWLPPVLTAEGIGEALKSNFHVNVLDRVSLQCEPDSEDYIRVHETVYDHVEQNKLYDLLRSTKYFGSVVWYLVTKRTIAGLLEDMLKRNLLSNALDLVLLHTLVHPDARLSETKADTDLARIQLIKEFCDKQELKQLFSIVRSIEHELLDSSQTVSESHAA